MIQTTTTNFSSTGQSQLITVPSPGASRGDTTSTWSAPRVGGQGAALVLIPAHPDPARPTTTTISDETFVQNRSGMTTPRPVIRSRSWGKPRLSSDRHCLLGIPYSPESADRLFVEPPHRCGALPGGSPGLDRPHHRGPAVACCKSKNGTGRPATGLVSGPTRSRLMRDVGTARLGCDLPRDKQKAAANAVQCAGHLAVSAEPDRR